MKVRRKTTRYIPKESKEKTKYVEKEKQIVLVHSAPPLEASSISSSSSSQRSVGYICDTPTRIDDIIPNEYRENESDWDSRREELHTLDTENGKEQAGGMMNQDSPSSRDTVNSSESTYSSETSSEPSIRHKPIQKKRKSQKDIKKTKWNWRIWQALIGWFGNKTQEESMDV